jgi:hypothetical protein
VQLELEVLPNEKATPSDSLEAKAEIFLVMFCPWQVGQVTLPIMLVFNTSASNGLPQSAHTNLKMGIFNSRNKITKCKRVN